MIFLLLSFFFLDRIQCSPVTKPRMTLIFQPPCLYLPSVGITGVHRHTQFYVVLGTKSRVSQGSGEHSTSSVISQPQTIFSLTSFILQSLPPLNTIRMPRMTPPINVTGISLDVCLTANHGPLRMGSLYTGAQPLMMKKTSAPQWPRYCPMSWKQDESSL